MAQATRWQKTLSFNQNLNWTMLAYWSHSRRAPVKVNVALALDSLQLVALQPYCHERLSLIFLYSLMTDLRMLPWILHLPGFFSVVSSSYIVFYLFDFGYDFGYDFLLKIVFIHSIESILVSRFHLVCVWKFTIYGLKWVYHSKLSKKVQTWQIDDRLADSARYQALSEMLLSCSRQALWFHKILPQALPDVDASLLIYNGRLLRVFEMTQRSRNLKEHWKVIDTQMKGCHTACNSNAIGWIVCRESSDSVFPRHRFFNVRSTFDGQPESASKNYPWCVSLKTQAQCFWSTNSSRYALLYLTGNPFAACSLSNLLLKNHNL